MQMFGAKKPLGVCVRERENEERLGPQYIFFFLSLLRRLLEKYDLSGFLLSSSQQGSHQLSGLLLLLLLAAVRRPQWHSEAAEVPSFLPAPTGRLDDVQTRMYWSGMRKEARVGGRTAAEILKDLHKGGFAARQRPPCGDVATVLAQRTLPSLTQYGSNWEM